MAKVEIRKVYGFNLPPSLIAQMEAVRPEDVPKSRFVEKLIREALAARVIKVDMNTEGL